MESKGSEGVYSARNVEDRSVSLFLAPTIPVEDEVCCSTHSSLVSDSTCEFLPINLHGNICDIGGNRMTVWPSRTVLHCWQDTHPFQTTPVCITHSYDDLTRCYVVYGNFCSPNCALAYIKRDRRHDEWERTCLFQEMMLRVFHVNVAGMAAAPPMVALQEFGGPYTIQQYRAAATTCDVSLLAPPFVLFPLLLQVRQKVQQQQQQQQQAQQQPDAAPAEEGGHVLQTGHVLHGLRRPAQSSVEPAIPMSSPAAFTAFAAAMQVDTAIAAPLPVVDTISTSRIIAASAIADAILAAHATSATPAAAAAAPAVYTASPASVPIQGVAASAAPAARISVGRPKAGKLLAQPAPMLTRVLQKR